jgi:hypothetical protein
MTSVYTYCSPLTPSNLNVSALFFFVTAHFPRPVAFSCPLAPSQVGIPTNDKDRGSPALTRLISTISVQLPRTLHGDVGRLSGSRPVTPRALASDRSDLVRGMALGPVRATHTTGIRLPLGAI